MVIKSVAKRISSKREIRKFIYYVVNDRKSLGDKPILIKQFLRGYDMEDWVEQLKSNDNARRYNHSRRTTFRHDLISFHHEDSEQLTRSVLRDIARKYLEVRAKNSMGFASVHYDKKHIHIHVGIAAVQLDGSSSRVSKKEFQEQKIEMESYQRERHPELKHSQVNYSKKKVEVPP